jgi:peptidoglycan-associated lipoprotein
MKKTLFLLTILSMTLMIISCGALKKNQTAGLSDAENVDRGEIAAEEEGSWQSGSSQGRGAGSAFNAESEYNDVLFDYDKYNIRQDARPTLNDVSSYLNENKETKAVVEGHGDERGTNEYNLALGEKRARATKNYMRSLGVSPSRISIVTYGEEKPLCISYGESCWQRNRRSSIKLSDLD